MRVWQDAHCVKSPVQASWPEFHPQNAQENEFKAIVHVTRKAWQQKREAAGNTAVEGEEVSAGALFTFSFYSVLDIACEMAPNSFQIQLNQSRNSFTAMPRNSSSRQA